MALRSSKSRISEWTSTTRRTPSTAKRSLVALTLLTSSFQAGGHNRNSWGDKQLFLSLNQTSCSKILISENKKAILSHFLAQKVAGWIHFDESPGQNDMRKVICDLCEQSILEKNIEKHFDFCKKLFKNQRALNEVNSELEHSFDQIKRLSRSTKVLVKVQKYLFPSLVGS